MRFPEIFGEGQSLLSKRQPGAQCSPHQMDGCEVSARQKRLKLRRRIPFDPFSERDRPLRGLLQLHRGIAFIRHERSHESGLDKKFLLIALLAFGKPPQDLDASV